jgi:uncharacterized membrane protein YadS
VEGGVRVFPGLALSALIAITATTTTPLLARIVPVPAMVIALFMGIALHPIARRPLFQRGIVFCMKTRLRRAVVLLGLRVGLPASEMYFFEFSTVTPANFAG